MKDANLRIAEVNAMRDILVSIEPLLVVLGGAAGLGVLENARWGERDFQLISSNQKRALLAGLIVIEAARAGVIGQAASLVEAGGEVAGKVTEKATGAVTALAPLLGAM